MKSRKNQRLTTMLWCLVILAGLYGPLALCPDANGQGPSWSSQPLSEGHFLVCFDQNRLSLKARDANVREVLSELGRVTGIDVKVDPRVDGKVTASFHGLPVEEAIKQIAGNWAMVFVEKQGSCRIARIVVPASGPPEPIAVTGSNIANSQQWGRSDRSLAVGRDRVQPRFVPMTPRSAGPDSLGFVPGELLVRFRRGVPQKRIDQVLAQQGAAVRRHNSRGNYCVLTLPQSQSVPEAAAWLASQDIVAFAEPNYLLTVQDTPNDDRFNEQWALAHIEAEAGWVFETGRPEVIIAIIDTGIDYNHPDLAANIWHNDDEIPENNEDDDGNGYIDDDRGWDFVENATNCLDQDCDDRDNDPMDGQGHGTHVAGIAGAVTDNGLGIAGTAWRCSIMAVRAGYRDSEGHGKLEVDDAADAIGYAADNGASVLNVSWGGNTDYTPIREAIDQATQNGVIICAAAGNNGKSVPFYPAAYAYPLVLAVGATDVSDQKPSYSNFGGWVDVSAPGGVSGDKILSTCVGGGYCEKSGTSMATPHVTGLAALLLSRFSGWSPVTITDILLDSVRVVSDLNGYNATSGIVDLQTALEVDGSDLAFFMGHIAPYLGQTNCGGSAFCEGDLDGDGDVDGADLAGLCGYSGG